MEFGVWGLGFRVNQVLERAWRVAQAYYCVGICPTHPCPLHRASTSNLEVLRKLFFLLEFVHEFKWKEQFFGSGKAPR